MHITIVGGGVIGLASAYQLARDGAQVTLLDARATGQGASEANAGWVCPAEAAPVPAPGLVGQALKWMLHRDSPLYIRPSLDPAFLSFMLRMWRHCNAADHRAGTAALLRLTEGTMGLLDDYRADGVDFEMHASGLLMAFRSAASLEAHQGDLDLLESYGWDSEVLMGDAVREAEPALSDEVAGGIRFSGDRHVDPAALVRGLRRRCLELDVEIVEDARVDDVEWRGTCVTAVTAGGRRFAGDTFLLAAGAWTGALSKRFGRPLPIQPGKGYSVDVPRLALRAPVYLTEARVAVTPLDGKLRLAGTMEFGGLDERIDPARVRAISRAPAAFFRDWQEDAESVLGAGVRPMTPDGLPLIGRLGRLPNVYVSTGHAMLGVTLAARSAQVISGLMLDGHADPALEPFSPARF